MTSIEKTADLAKSTSSQRSNLTEKGRVTWGEVLSLIELLADRLDRGSGTGPTLIELSRQLRACPSGMLDEYSDTAAELSGLIEQAHQLIDLDPSARDPFWALRNLLSDITRSLADKLEQASDPLFSSEQALESYLASVLLTSGADGLGDILRDQGDRERRRLVAALAYRLARSRDTAGIVIWFLTPRPQLGNRTPAAVLESERTQAARLLLPLAGGSEVEASRSLANLAQSP
jgi:hypothetical protein